MSQLALPYSLLFSVRLAEGADPAQRSSKGRTAMDLRVEGFAVSSSKASRRHDKLLLEFVGFYPQGLLQSVFMYLARHRRS